MFKRFLKSIALASICQLAKFGDLMRCGSKDVFKNTPMHHDVIDLLNHGMAKDTKAWIS